MDKKLKAKLKAKIKPLVEEKATREYFIEKMRVDLSRMWKAGQTNNLMYERTKWQYERFIDKVEELDEAIFNMMPPGIHPNEVMRLKIVDSL